MITYSENLKAETEPLDLKPKGRFTKFIFHVRKECLEPGYEYEWDRVQRMRRENHPLMRGGNSRNVKLDLSYHFQNFDRLKQNK